MAGTQTKRRAWIGALIVVLIATAVLTKLFLFPSVNDTDFTLSDRNLLDAPSGVALIRPTRYSFLRRNNGIEEAWYPGHQAEWRAVGRDVPLRRAFAVAYGADQFRVVLPLDAPTNNFDFLLTFSTNQEQHMQEAIRRTLGYSGHVETRRMPVLALVIHSKDLPGLKVSKSHSEAEPSWGLVDFPVAILTRPLERRLQQLVVDETGLTNRYDFDWDFGPHDRSTLDKMLSHLGLALEAQTVPIDVLVVEKDK
jgi:uncharacterized protein (TIGR03435 family)